MKLKNVMIGSFVAITVIPLMVMSILLYKSGFDLSRESYTRNLTESINVQADYIAQVIENNLVADYRFAVRSTGRLGGSGTRELLLSDMRSYLENSEDKIAVCLLLDEENNPLYTIGEKAVLDLVLGQLPPISQIDSQSIMEFSLGSDVYSLGSITPIRDSNGGYAGSLVSVYDKSYIFKSISSYYEIADSSTYICRADGDIVHFRGQTDDTRGAAIAEAIASYDFLEDGTFDIRIDSMPILGYYKNIYNTPWYLVGIVDHHQIYSFLNRFVWVYILVIVAVFIVDVLLAAAVSKRMARPINNLIRLMDGYPDSLENPELNSPADNGYYETKYLNSKFLNLMSTILRVQHNFEGVYQLYQSNAMDDTNIDINVMEQTIHCNKEAFTLRIDELVVPEGACIVERFTNCFCDKDRDALMDMFVGMRDQHLSVTREAEVFSPCFDQKWFHILVVPMYEAHRLSRLFIQLRDITGFKRQEARSLEQTKREPLTGLYNRLGFAELSNALLRDADPDAMHAVFFADLNCFKMVNDNFGHGAGDELLLSVAKALLQIVRKEDIVARFGGDEFALFLPNTSPAAVARVKEAMALLQYPFGNELLSFTISLSVGVAICDPNRQYTLNELLDQADSAMYEEKRAFKSAQ